MTRSSYHHGDLREALITTGVELARAEGPGAVVLREAARRVGVSATASYRHFADRKALLLAVRARALSCLGQRMLDDSGDPQPLAHFRTLGQSYVAFALAEPGLFRTFAAPGIPVRPSDETADPNPFRLLGAALDDLVTAGLLAPEQRLLADAVAWSAVHGLSVLLLDGLLPRTRADELISRTLDGVAFGLMPTPGPAPCS